MRGDPRIASIYGQANAEPPTGDEAIERNREMFRALWHKFGHAAFLLDDILNDWDRQHVENIAKKLYGERK